MGSSYRQALGANHEAKLNGQQRAAHVGDGVGNEKGRDLLVALRTRKSKPQRRVQSAQRRVCSADSARLRQQLLHAVLEDGEAAHAGAAQDAATAQRRGAHVR
jgi:hypothetical protein